MARREMLSRRWLREHLPKIELEIKQLQSWDLVTVMMEDMLRSYWSIGRVLFKNYFAWNQFWLILGSHPLSGEGGCYVIRGCKLWIWRSWCYVLERLNYNLYYTIRKLILYKYIYSFRIYTFSYQDPLNFADTSIFLQKVSFFLAKIVPFLKAIVWVLR